MLNQNFPLISAHWNILMDFMIQIMLVVHRQKLLANSRAATGDKAAKAWSFAGFWETENSSCSGSALVKWPRLWCSCLPKIYCCRPESKRKAFSGSSERLIVGQSAAGTSGRQHAFLSDLWRVYEGKQQAWLRLIRTLCLHNYMTWEKTSTEAAPGGAMACQVVCYCCAH